MVAVVLVWLFFMMDFWRYRVILSLLGALVLVASLYDAYKPRKSKSSDVAPADVTNATGIKMTVITPPEAPACHINMAFAQSNSDVNTNNNNVGDSQSEKRNMEQPEIVAGKTMAENEYNSQLGKTNVDQYEVLAGKIATEHEYNTINTGPVNTAPPQETLKPVEIVSNEPGRGL